MAHHLRKVNSFLCTAFAIHLILEECREEFSDVDEDELERYLQVTVDKKVEALFSKEVINNLYSIKRKRKPLSFCS